MLPAGLEADPLPPSAVAADRALLPGAQTAVALRVGRCACDLVRPRLRDAREDERHLRQRYAQLGLPRERIIRELERHRRRTHVAEPAAGWRMALADFVAEHARNAGTTLYHLAFEPSGRSPTAERTGRRTVEEVRSAPDGWLQEDVPLLVVR